MTNGRMTFLRIFLLRQSWLIAMSVALSFVSIMHIFTSSVSAITQDQVITYTDGFLKFYDGQNQAVGYQKGDSPIWSHDGTYLYYIDELNRVVQYDYDLNTIDSRDSFPNGITPKKISISPNDSYMAFTTANGRLYQYDLDVGPSSLVELTAAFDSVNPNISHLEWDLGTNQIFYSKDDIGILGINLDGSGKHTVYSNALMGRSSQITSFSTDPNFGGSGSYTSMYLVSADGTISRYTESSIFNYRQEYGVTLVNNLPGDVGSVHFTFIDGSDTTGLMYTVNNGTEQSIGEYYPASNTNEILSSVTTNDIFNSVRLRPINNHSSLYAPEFQSVMVASEGGVDFRIAIRANSAQLRNNTYVDIIPILYDSNFNALQTGSKLTVYLPSSQTGDYVDYSFGLSFSGRYYLGCTISAGADPALSQVCNSPYQIDYIKPLYTHPVFRFWSPKNQHHFFTANEAEAQYIVDNYPEEIWTYEGVAYSAPADCTGKQSVYRFWSPRLSTHFFTMNTAEKDYIIGHYDTNTWTYEGVAYCADASQNGTNTPLYRFWSPRLQGHFFTADSAEKDYIISHYDTNTWTYEGVAYYVEP